MQPFTSQKSINFVVQKTGLPADLVEKLSCVEIPSFWIEWLEAILDESKKPGTLALHERMIEERDDFIKQLPSDEIWEIQEIKAVDEYLERLVNECAVEKGTATIFACTLLEWYMRVQEAIAALNEKVNPTPMKEV